ncbi:MAG TPA: methyltransferase [Kofleriaceae bacterium]|nr:methyltransferase [Kofleriaceae bacterium]
MTLEELADLKTPWCLRVAATLRIADHLASGPRDIAELAAIAGCDADSLHRVLGHLADRGVFEQPAPGRFALNDAARPLCEPAVRIGLDLDGIGGRFAHAWGTMLSAVRSGQCAYAERFGLPFWDDLAAHPAVAAAFDDLMGSLGHGTPDPEVLVGGDWSAVRTVVDVGGGTGSLLAEILRAHPGVRGTLVDLPHTVARAAPVFEAAGVADRATVVGRSFFDALPPGADLYVLKSVLNDWPDREALAILQRCAEALPPAGRVAILGGVVPDGTGHDGITEDLIVARGLGGKPRTVERLRGLAQGVGLAVVATGRQPSGRFVVECKRITG